MLIPAGASRLVIPVALTISLAAAVPAASAQSAPVDVVSVVDHAYGSVITVRATIRAASPVSRAVLFYRPPGGADTRVEVAALLPGEPPIAKVVIDTRSSPLPPFTPLSYWWQVDLADGTSTSTVPASYLYTDNRFEWQSLSAFPLTIHWVDGDLAFAQGLLNSGLEALASIQRDLAIPPPPAIDVYVYPALSDLQSGLRLGGRNWAGGQANPDLAAILLAGPPSAEAQLELASALPHELTHILLYQRMGEAYDYLPTWLREGLATARQPALPSDGRVALERAVEDGRLLPLSTLCSAFPVEGERALLAYAESAALVQYIADIYGTGSIAALLDAYQEGVSCTGGIQRVFQRSPEQLTQEWLRTDFSVLGAPGAADVFPWLAAGIPILVLLAAALVYRVARPRKHTQEPRS